MTWLCRQYTPSNNADAIYQFKELLKTAGWSVVASSDNATLNSSGDTITNSGTGVGGLDRANAWFVVQMPNTFAVGSTLKRQVLFQRGTSSNFFRMAYTITGFTGGTATVAPTANDQFFVSGTTLGTYTIDEILDTYATTPYKVFAAADNVAPYGFYFAPLTISPISGSLLRGAGGFMLDPMATGSFVAPTGTDATTGDMDPYVFYLQQPSQTSSSFTYLKYAYSVSFGFNDLNGKARGYYMANTASQATQFYAGYHALGTLSSYTQANPYNFRDTLVPLYWSINSVDAPTTSYLKGVSSTAYYVLQDRNPADSLSVATTSARDFIYVGDCALPWDGTIPVL